VGKMLKIVLAVFLVVAFLIMPLEDLTKAQAASGTYKAVINTSKILIRENPTSKSRIIGMYFKGEKIDIIGRKGEYLKTPQGYILSKYVKVYDGTSNGNQSGQAGNGGVNAGSPLKYIVINQDVQIMNDLNGGYNERYAVKGETFEVLENVKGYYKIKVGKISGYIPSSFASPLSYVPKNKIIIAWDQTSNKAGTKTLYDENEDYVRKSSVDLGLDVLSPTWFGITGDGKNPVVFDFGDREYVKIAHRNGFEVWPRFAEMDKNRAYIWINDPVLRTKVIENIVSLSKQYELDGINFDFELLSDMNKDGYTEFMKEAYQRLKQEGLTVSTDIMTPAPWNNWYNNSVVKNYTDYMMLMAYDEHYSGSNIAGSVGSYSFVENGTKGILAQGVPQNKLILGVPFYTRDFATVDITIPITEKSVIATKDTALYASTFMDNSTKWLDVKLGDIFKWISTYESFYVVELQGEQIYMPAKDGVLVEANTKPGTVVGSSSTGMQSAEATVLANGGSFRYDDVAKQRVGEYYKDGLKHMIWMEDKDSMSWRMDLANQYNLAGAAAWSLYWKPSDDIWDVIKKKLK
jgi:spore germination protein YaaH